MKKVAEYGSTDGQKLLIDGIEYDTAKEFLIIRLNAESRTKLNAMTNYTLSMNFVAKLTNSSIGFFRSSYMEDGIEK